MAQVKLDVFAAREVDGVAFACEFVAFEDGEGGVILHLS